MSFLIGLPDYTTFSYQQAQRNRINDADLEPGGQLDIRSWPAVFVYDILQFPGSLASVLGRSSSLDYVYCMTPGKTLKPIFPKAMYGDGSDSESGLEGMIVVGRGKTNRQDIEDHYGKGFRRKRVDVEVTLASGRSRVLYAYTWVPANQLIDVWNRERKLSRFQVEEERSDWPGGTMLSYGKRSEDSGQDDETIPCPQLDGLEIN